MKYVTLFLVGVLIFICGLSYSEIMGIPKELNNSELLLRTRSDDANFFNEITQSWKSSDDPHKYNSMIEMKMKDHIQIFGEDCGGSLRQEKGENFNIVFSCMGIQNASFNDSFQQEARRIWGEPKVVKDTSQIHTNLKFYNYRAQWELNDFLVDYRFSGLEDAKKRSLWGAFFIADKKNHDGLQPLITIKCSGKVKSQTQNSSGSFQDPPPFLLYIDSEEKEVYYNHMNNRWDVTEFDERSIVATSPKDLGKVARLSLDRITGVLILKEIEENPFGFYFEGTCEKMSREEMKPKF